MKRVFEIPSQVAKKIYEAQVRPEDGFIVVQKADRLEITKKTSAEPIPLVKLICRRNGECTEGKFEKTPALEKGILAAQVLFVAGGALGWIHHLRPFTMEGLLVSVVMTGFILIGIYLLPKLGDLIFRKESARLLRLLRRAIQRKELQEAR